MNQRLLENESFKTIENQRIMTHWHGSIELIRVQKGRMHCLINGQKHTIKTGDVCMINTRRLHRIYCDANGNCEFQRLMIDPNLFTAERPIYEKYIEPVLSDDRFSHLISKAGSAFAREVITLLNEIARLEEEQPLAYELNVIALLHMLFQRFYEAYHSGKKNNAPLPQGDLLLHHRMLDYIYQNYAEKITLDDIAAAGNVSRSKCCNVFKEYAQRSPMEFLNLYRLEVSTDQLRETDESISNISLACGFGQQSYYNRLFQREYGMTPREYRIQRKKEVRR